jgi:hypothetical protein
MACEFSADMSNLSSIMGLTGRTFVPHDDWTLNGNVLAEYLLCERLYLPCSSGQPSPFLNSPGQVNPAGQGIHHTLVDKSTFLCREDNVQLQSTA